MGQGYMALPVWGSEAGGRGVRGSHLHTHTPPGSTPTMGMGKAWIVAWQNDYRRTRAVLHGGRRELRGREKGPDLHFIRRPSLEAEASQTAAPPQF
ncbi:hypothetical protein GGTG_04395 [Gaeumannomyces tritici R3-111a-1]|uniref:Uncharacterized protein n=1 Tax=Gaeumannomyces tritici (strain R3-111a-1) TaxID=644352 RepID=J3NSZ7_GAET3|nr:hypothetical protein GGTG_04395 [Gaeumannomyces tritici R3-111a-1]EJT79310.1 hypothetical protein GGTG_04395 [Gaeumannomyces tritici R3-111a-1]